ncbi:serine/threonine-protein kinase [Lentisphaera profundi]|uniref:Serine/threonine-protein kinase n=1 Tax=Lentisphaera profundi TaxID=1658616 RepID=A0ABY7W0U4_9BACT|nr:serine/threonine-protein kinase [Lentisphaera profundi]WDE98651.1 serine/threonine-protein kinase [Lentisphaera profundi]
MAAAQRQIGPYKIIGRPLGTGGMATVYRVDDGSGQHAALKVLHAHLNREQKVVKRFKQEFAIGQKMAHFNNFVNMRTLEKVDNSWCILMQLVEGKTLEHRLLEIPQAIAVVASLANALHSFHGKGLVHRDIKPENIILSHAGELKIMDYGITRELANNMTRTGTAMGTLLYMSPEQLKAEKSLDHRADIYSLGVIFYRLLSKRDPQALSNKAEYVQVMDSRLKRKMRPLPGIKDEKLNNLLERMMAMDPNDRPKDCKVLVSELQKLSATPSNIKKVLSAIAKEEPKKTKAASKASPKVNKTIQRAATKNEAKKAPATFIMIGFIIFVLAFAGLYFFGPQQLRDELQKIVSG